jgi:hypothetical protein
VQNGGIIESGENKQSSHIVTVCTNEQIYITLTRHPPWFGKQMAIKQWGIGMTSLALSEARRMRDEERE